MTTGKDKEMEILEVPFRHLAEYLYSYGEISRFFREEKENKQLYATKCRSCGKVWMPPRGYCSDCYGDVDWIPLSGEGTVVTCAYCYQASVGDLPKVLGLPFILALIKLDGTDTLLMHAVAAPGPMLDGVKSGDRVKVYWREPREGKISDFYFVLA